MSVNCTPFGGTNIWIASGTTKISMPYTNGTQAERKQWRSECSNRKLCADHCDCSPDSQLPTANKCKVMSTETTNNYSKIKIIVFNVAMLNALAIAERYRTLATANSLRMWRIMCFGYARSSAGISIVCVSFCAATFACMRNIPFSFVCFSSCYFPLRMPPEAYEAGSRNFRGILLTVQSNALIIITRLLQQQLAVRLMRGNSMALVSYPSALFCLPCEIILFVE